MSGATAIVRVLAVALAMFGILASRLVLAQDHAAEIHVVVLVTETSASQRSLASMPEGLRDKLLYWRRVKSKETASYQLSLGFFDRRDDAERASTQLAATFPGARVIAISPVERDDVFRARQKATLAAATPVAPLASAVSRPLPSAAAALQPLRPSAPGDVSLEGHIEAGLARETTRMSEIKLGDGPVLVLSGVPVRLSDTFRHIEGGAGATVDCGKALSCVVNINGDSRTGLNSNQFDISIAHGDAGVRYAAGSTVYGLRAAREQWDVGSESFRRVNSLTGDAVSAFGKQFSGYASLSLARYEHPGDNAFLDADYRAVTGNLRWAAGDAWQSAYSVQATLSREDNRQNDASLDVRGALLRLGWEAKPLASWQLRFALMEQTLRYRDVDPVFGVQRSDRYAAAELVLTYKLGDRLRFRLEALRAAYRSNAAILDNDWSSVGAGLLFDF